METTVETDVAVIGGGLAGLLAAAAVAESGRRVVVLERAKPGGRARSRKTETGFWLNRGPHALYVGQALDQALRGFGIVPRGGRPPRRGARGLADGRIGLLPAGPGSLLTTDLVPNRVKVQMARTLVGIPRLDPDDYSDQSIDQWLDGRSLHPSVRRLVTALVRLTSYIHDPDIASAGAVIAQMRLALTTGVLYLDGGWQQLVDALAAKGADLGVEVRAGCGVRRVEGTTIRLDDDTTLTAGSIIMAGLGPRQVAGLVAGSVDLSEAAGPPIHASCLDIGIRGQGTHWLVVGVDQPFYLSRHSPPAALAPPGCVLYSAMRYLGRDDDHDSGETADRLKRLAVQAGIEPDTMVETSYSHRLVTAQGQPLAERGGLKGRPAVSDLGVPGVFLAGDWVGPEGLLADASAASALVAAQRALDYCNRVPCHR